MRNDLPLRKANMAQFYGNASPVLNTKDNTIQKQKFYTPHLNAKNVQNESLNALIELKYQNRRLNGKFNNNSGWLKKPGNEVSNETTKENAESFNHMEEECTVDSKLIKTSANKKGEGIQSSDKQDHKKLTKIQALFKPEKFEQLNIHEVIQTWSYLSSIYEHIITNKNPINAIHSLINHFNPPSNAEFIEVFTEYNNIKQKIKNFYFLKIWSCILFIYINDMKKNNLDLKLLTWFETIYCQLLQSIFYVSLIISKALRNNCIQNDKQKIEYFSKYLQKFNFPTGIPLIKTLKANNENVFLALKNVLNMLDPSLSIQFEKSYLTDLNCLYTCLRNVLLFFSPLMSSNYQSAFYILSSQLASNSQTNEIVFNRDLQVLIQTPTTKRYTLVFDLDETLIHFKSENSKSKFLIRPHAYNIIRNLQEHFEIIIFTAAQKEYADYILNLIDNQAAISHRFYREHCQMGQNCHIKVC